MAANVGSIFGTLRMKTGLLKRDLQQSSAAVRKFTVSSAAQMQTMGASVAGVTKKLFNMRNLLIGGGTFLFFRAAIKQVSGFEKELTKVATLVDDTSIVFGKFKNSIKDMSITFGQSKETLAEGLFDIISATIDTSDALEVLENSTKLAVAGFTEAGTATSAVITVFQTYRDEVKNAEDASDLLFATMKRGRLTVAQVAENIGTVASVAKGAGVSLEDLSAGFSAISRSGSGAERTVVQLMAFINSFAGAGEDAKMAAALLGVEMDNVSIANNRLVPTIAKMKEGLDKMSDSLRANTIKAMFPNRRAQQGFNTLILQSAALVDDYKAALDRQGLTQVALEKVMGKSYFVFEQFREAIIALVKTIGEGLLPFVTKGTVKMTEFIKSLEDSGALHQLTLELKGFGDQLMYVAKAIGFVWDATAKTMNFLMNVDPVGMGIDKIKELLAAQDALAAQQGMKGLAMPGGPTRAGFDAQGQKEAGGLDEGLGKVTNAAKKTEKQLVSLDGEINQKGVDLTKMGNTGETVFGKMKNAVMGWASNFSSSFVDVMWSADRSFKGMLESFSKMITEMIFQLMVVEPLMKAVMGGSGGGTGGFLSGLFGGGGGPTGGGGLPTVAQASGQQSIIGMISPLEGLNFDKGGIVPGRVGQPVPITAHGGEQIIPVGERNMQSDRPIELTVVLNNPVDPAAFQKTDEEVVNLIADNYTRGAIIRKVIREDIG
ncbi:MAG: phage tail tape measure protein [Gammaproteobacteria bacterium]|nr:phage tail tape measure protein [Gammaproteobacteria bacterium]